MKKTLIFIALIIAALTFESCNSKSSEEQSDATLSASETAVSQSDQRALVKAKEAALKQKRNAEREALMMNTPFYTNDAGLTVYNKAEVAPSYIGGDEAMEKYLEKSLRYPKEAQEEGLEGTVYVDFLVATDGAVSNVTATTSTWENVDEQFNTEAIRVVSSMPNWVPGMQNGEKVYVAYSIPITFRLN